MNNSSDYIIIILGQNQTYGHEMTAVFSPVHRTFKSQDPSGNSRHPSAGSGNGKPAGTRSGSSGGRRPRAYAGGPSFEFRSIIKPVLLIIIIILLLLIIKMIRPATDAKPDSTAAVSTESLAPETEAETVAAESTVYRTTDTVNVRPEPSTDTDRIGVLAPDTDVEYLRDYDEKWAVISYNGQEAYVSRDFIRQVSQ